MKKMIGNKRKNFLYIATLIILLFGLCFYCNNPKNISEIPKIPDAQILYSPLVFGERLEYINFLNPSSNIIKQLHIETSPLSFLKSNIGVVFGWGLDNKSISGIIPTRFSPSYGNPIIIYRDGSIDYCMLLSSYFLYNSVLAVSDSSVMAIQEHKYTKKQSLILFNMKKCKVEKKLLETNEDEELFGFAYSTRNVLALDIASANFSGITLLDEEMDILRKIPHAANPSFSKDGKNIAFILNSDQLCLEPVLSTNERVCYDDIKSRVSWSPDSHFVVFSNSNAEIIIVNLETEEQQSVAKGLWPDWSP